MGLTSDVGVPLFCLDLQRRRHDSRWTVPERAVAVLLTAASGGAGKPPDSPNPATLWRVYLGQRNKRMGGRDPSARRCCYSEISWIGREDIELRGLNVRRIFMAMERAP